VNTLRAEQPMNRGSMPDKGKRFLFPRKHPDLLCNIRMISLPECQILGPADDHLFPPSEGQATPVQAWTEPEGSRRLRLPDFMTIST